MGKSNKTHLGQPVKNLVALAGRVTGSGTVNSFVRVFPDGTTQPFNIPANNFLVITDMDIIFIDFPPNRNQSIFLDVGSPNAFITSTPSDSGGEGGTSVSMTTGVVVSSGTTISVIISGAGATSSVDVNLQGYLIKSTDDD